jgi:PKD repeat protein
VTSGTAPLSVQFNDTSATDITDWLWDFDDGNTSTTQNPVNTFYNGNYHVNLNVTNASGYNDTALDYLISVSESGGLDGVNKQDIEMDQLFTLTLNYKASGSLETIPVVTVLDSRGSTTTTSIGTAVLSYNYTIIVIYSSAEGYQSKASSYIIDRDRTETIYLTPETVSPTPQTMTYYTPWQVRIRIADFYGNPLPGTNVTANYMASTLPSTNISWLVSAYGVEAATAAEMTDNGIAMAGQTDSNGGLSFSMFKSLQYSLLITNTTSGVSATKNLYPSDQEYLIRVPIAGQVVVNNTLAAMAKTSLPVYQLNATAYNLSVIYQDTSGLTTDVLFYVRYRNGTVLYYQDLGNPGTGIVSANYTVSNLPMGMELLWSYNARRE